MLNTEIPDDFSGALLIASPYLEDANFRCSVVFLASENERGILGFILNRRTESKLHDFWRQIFGKECPFSANVYIGGPVAGPLTVLHQAPEYADVSVGDGHFLTMEKNLIGELVYNQVQPVKFFLGQSGWTRDQLIGEIESGAWHLLAPGQEDLFREDSEFWIRSLQKSAGQVFAQVLGLPDIPTHPEDN
ncbi:MAG: YqgE/AlgH family protein [Thermoguttaceae bacterium]|nr:YqgE/AlgH family protein [Thermoguttaceae bacterium]